MLASQELLEDVVLCHEVLVAVQSCVALKVVLANGAWACAGCKDSDPMTGKQTNPFGKCAILSWNWIPS